MEWSGIFDLPGALVPERCFESQKMYELIAETMIRDGSCSRFRELITQKYQAHLEAREAARKAAQKAVRPAAPQANAVPKPAEPAPSPKPKHERRPAKEAPKNPDIDWGDPAVWIANRPRRDYSEEDGNIVAFLGKLAAEQRAEATPPFAAPPGPQSDSAGQGASVPAAPAPEPAFCSAPPLDKAA